MMIADILHADHKLPTLTQLNAKFNLEWQNTNMISSYQPFQLNGEHLIQSNTSTTFIQYQPLLYTTNKL